MFSLKTTSLINLFFLMSHRLIIEAIIDLRSQTSEIPKIPKTISQMTMTPQQRSIYSIREHREHSTILLSQRSTGWSKLYVTCSFPLRLRQIFLYMITLDEALRLSDCHLGIIGGDPIVRTNDLQHNYENKTLLCHVWHDQVGNRRTS